MGEVGRQKTDFSQSHDVIIEEDSLIEEIARQDGLIHDTCVGANVADGLLPGTAVWPTSTYPGPPSTREFHCFDVEGIGYEWNRGKVSFEMIDDQARKAISKQKTPERETRLSLIFQNVRDGDFMEETTSHAFLRIELEQVTMPLNQGAKRCCWTLGLRADAAKPGVALTPGAIVVMACFLSVLGNPTPARSQGAAGACPPGWTLVNGRCMVTGKGTYGPAPSAQRQIESIIQGHGSTAAPHNPAPFQGSSLPNLSAKWRVSYDTGSFDL